MRTPRGCKLFGAQQALGGIQNGVILFHSVIGCNFGSMSFHVPADMRDIRQTCTVINDSDIIFSGEDSLRKAIHNALDLFHPSVLFVVSGCVSEIIGDDIAAVVSEISGSTPVIYVEAAGFRGDSNSGYEAACQALLPYLQGNPVAGGNAVNLIGLGGDDYRIQEDVEAFQRLLGEQVALHTVLSHCSWEDLKTAPQANLNLVLNEQALPLAKAMQERFGIPYEQISYPYGVTGAKEVYSALERHFEVEYETECREIERLAAEGASKAYPYLQALYGMPAAVIGSGGRADGMRRFLEQELGMEVVCFCRREELSDLEDFFMPARQSEVALLFGSSFELELAEELGIPLIRYDYPVFDEISLTGKPFVGAAGILSLLEIILNSVMQTPSLKGALYQ